LPTMRVEMHVAEEAGKQGLRFPPAEDYVELRGNPSGALAIPAAVENPPLRNFLDSVNAPESLFASFGASASEIPAEASAATPGVFRSRVTLVYSELALNIQSDLYEQLAVQLAGLLLRESGDALSCDLEVARCAFAGGDGQCLRVTLTARAANAEQARLRWGLGLARVQQALLYCSRQMRQKMGAGDSSTATI
jgi:hypothetical protein